MNHYQMKTVRLLQAVYKLFPCTFVNIYTKGIKEKRVDKLLIVGYLLGLLMGVIKMEGRTGYKKTVLVKGSFKINTSQ